jgi:hypothetical protein
MWKFLKDIFSEKVEDEILSISELKALLLEKQKDLEEEYARLLKEKVKELENHRAELRAALQNLESAELRNPNIPEKAKHFMQGNRAAYVRLGGLFEKNIVVPKEISVVDHCIASFDSEVHRFTESTNRSYMILQDFFANESHQVAKMIKLVDSSFSELRDCEQKKTLSSINQLLGLIESHDSKVSLRKAKTSELESGKKELSTKQELREKLAIDTENLLKSKEYKEFLEIKEHYHREEDQKKKYERVFLDRFVVLEKPLRRLAHVAFEEEKFITKYLEDPLPALIGDYDLHILATLEKLRTIVEKNEIELDEKRKVKVIATINEFDEKSLGKFLTDYNTQARIVFDLAEESKNHPVIAQEKHLRDALSLLEDEINGQKRVLAILEDDIKGIDTHQMLAEIQKNVTIVLKGNFTIVAQKVAQKNGPIQGDKASSASSSQK